MNTYQFEVCGLKRELPLIKIKDDLAYSSFVVIGDTELVTAAAKELVDGLEPVEAVLTAEAKGIALSYEISRLLGLKEFIVARKSIKSYMNNPIKENVKSITTTEEQSLYLDESDVEKIKGKTICIVDDVISTGESLRAIENLAVKAGATVKYKMAILAEGDAATREDIRFIKKLPLFTVNENEEYIPIP